MKTLTRSLIAAGLVTISAPALAQTTTPSPNMQQTTPPTTGAPSNAAPTTAAPTTAAPAVSAASITDAEVTQFAKAVVALDAIQKDTTIPAEQKQTQMAAKVQEQGLEPAKFNAIAQTAQTDTTLQGKVQAAIQAEAGVSTTPAPTN
ncbi:DUF4168 domain-containing protein [Sphingomonas japonica]|uniref:DUF4168 domain-containing protein n=1 Tax=Sphingomonas japonica TaxID=511662 RepID=A0ABX0TYK5_9SPHN|nr:DUF4168 domain-containing protein [Sphingomonas japonica]NIJ23399.1 hypothetical protein [Sphingomonas japonica]